MNVFLSSEFERYYEESPLVLVDVGARGGLQPNWRQALEHLDIIGFEPDEEEYKALTKQTGKQATIYLNTGLYKEKASVNFYLTRSGGAASLLEPDRSFLDRFPEPERFDVLKTLKLDVDTLDNQLKAQGLVDVDFIKLDTQGSELFILMGAEEVLTRSVFGLEIEVEFAPIYKDQPLFAEVDRFLRGLGFQLFDLRPCYWKRDAGKMYGKSKGQMIFGDALYLRTPEALSSVVGAQSGPENMKSKLLRTLSICVLYGYLDYALELFEGHRDLFNPHEIAAFMRSLQRSKALVNRLPNFRGRGRIANIFYAIYKIINPSYKGWATGERVVGNLD